MERIEKEQLLRALREGDVASVASWQGFALDVVPVKGLALRAWGLSSELLEGAGELSVLAAGAGFRLLHIDGRRAGGESSWEAVRRVMMVAEESSPQVVYLWWWTTEKAWTAAMVDSRWEGEQRRRRVKKLVVELDYPDEVGLSQWLSFGGNTKVDRKVELSAEGWRAHFQEVLDQDGVTRQFFTRFSRALRDLTAGMVSGPREEQLRYEIALVTLLRVVFLYFLQARGALGQDRRFVMRRFVEEREESFYRGVLRPLFFGALNVPGPKRGEAARMLGDLPFLNGGLFEETPAEAAHSGLDWEDGLWAEILGELFERHRFAVEWSDEEDLSRAVDPEMLGKVFEGLIYGDGRGRSGSFYTPRHVVSAMVRRALSSWIREKVGLGEQEVQAALNGEAERLSARQRVELRQALASVTVLDPAVGTGAFLLEVLRVLRRVDRGLDEAERVIRTPGECYERMRRLVHDHLFGVDIQPTAVRLCELRIWLAMLAALPELPASKMPPLPNLSHRLCVGNSLIEPLDWVRFRVDGVGSVSALPCASPRFEGIRTEKLALLQESFTRAHGEEKVELKRALKQAQEELQRALLLGRQQRVREALEPLEALAKSRDLFGDLARLKEAQARQRQKLTRELSALEQALEDLEEGRRQEASFSFDAHFGPVMSRGGFDLVITNPPWVRSTKLDRAVKRLYSARYQSDDHRLWPKAGEMGVEATFGAQVDMASLFLERSLELLRPGGRLYALVPVKLFRSLHGAGLRGVLAQHQVEYIEDRSEDEEALFDATTYPAVVGVKKEEAGPKPGPVEVSLWRQGRVRRFGVPLKNLCAYGQDLREPWIMVEPEVERIFRKMQGRSMALGQVAGLPIRRGVMSGCNGAFLIDPAEAEARFSLPVREKFLRWAIQGRDLQDGGLLRRKQIIWPVDAAGSVFEELPRELEEHFEGYRARLLGRSDARRGRPLWDIFRRHEDLQGYGVVWRDLALQLEAAAMGPESIPLNTVYYLPTKSAEETQAMVTLLHSEPVRAMAYALGERARGGWRRHFAWVIRMLPVPGQWVELWSAGQVEELWEEQFIWELYGLSGDEVQRLFAFRQGVEVKPVREVA